MEALTGTNYEPASFLRLRRSPSGAVKGYLLGGLCRSATPFSLATSLGLESTALRLSIHVGKAGLVPPAVADHLLGEALR